MKLVVLLCLVAVAIAAPQNAELVRYDFDNDGLGVYRYFFEQTDGTKQEQQGELKNAGTDNESLAVKGQYSYVAPNGIRYIVTYTADENGYEPTIEEGPGVPGPAVASLLG